MFSKEKALTFLILFFITVTTANAQGKFKAGIGFNYISNNLDHQYLDSYFAQSLHLSYAIFQKPGFSVSLESANALKSSEEDYVRTTGFISSLPVTAQFELRKIALHAGAGPAYLYQRAVYDQQKFQVSGSSMHFLSGIAWKGAPFFENIIYPEFTVRLNYFKSFRASEYDAGMISFIIFLRGA